jgi:hypothetical protein
LSACPSVGAQPDAAPATSDDAIIRPIVPSPRKSSMPNPIPESAIARIQSVRLSKRSPSHIQSGTENSAGIV